MPERSEVLPARSVRYALKTYVPSGIALPLYVPSQPLSRSLVINKSSPQRLKILNSTKNTDSDPITPTAVMVRNKISSKGNKNDLCFGVGGSFNGLKYVWKA